MAIINQRWPDTLSPETCRFGRSRNDVPQVSPRTRQTTLIRMGRPLWAADLSWSLQSGETLDELRYWLEALDGFAGSVQLWNFAAPYPRAIGAAVPTHWALGATVQVAANAALNATSVQLKGLQASSPAVVKGQRVQFARRAYVVAASASSDGSGNVTITLLSGLLAAVVTNDAVRLSQAGCEMRMESSDFDETGDAGSGLIRVSASFVETVVDYA